MSDAPRLQWREQLADDQGNVKYTTRDFSGYPVAIYPVLRAHQLRWRPVRYSGGENEYPKVDFWSPDDAKDWCQAREDEVWAKAHPEPVGLPAPPAMTADEVLAAIERYAITVTRDECETDERRWNAYAYSDAPAGRKIDEYAPTAAEAVAAFVRNAQETEEPEPDADGNMTDTEIVNAIDVYRLHVSPISGHRIMAWPDGDPRSQDPAGVSARDAVRRCVAKIKERQAAQ